MKTKPQLSEDLYEATDRIRLYNLLRQTTKEEYDNNRKYWYFWFDDDNKKSYTYVLLVT